MPPTPEETVSGTASLNNDEVITKQFLQLALQKEANGGSVPEILNYSVTAGSKPGDNYMSLIYSVDVELDDGKKRHLLIKCYPNHPSRQEFNNKSNQFFKELEVYSKWMPELRRFQAEVVGLDKDQIILPYAHFVHGQCIDFQSLEGQTRISKQTHSLDNFIMMEDIRKAYGFRMTNRLEALDLDHMRLVIEALAKVHSLSWAYRHYVEANITEKFPCFVSNFDEKEVMEIWLNVLNSNLDQAIAIYDKEFGTGNDYSAAANNFRERAYEVIQSKFTAEGMEKQFRISSPDPTKFGINSENPEPWRIICHGDCWSNNLLFRYDLETGRPTEVVLVDLQMPQESCVVNDLQYLVFACTELELRNAHIDDLLQLYHDTFNSICKLFKIPTLPGFCMDSLRFRFHQSKFVGYFMATLVLPIVLNENKAVNLEDMEHDKELTDIFAEISSESVLDNDILKKRLVELTKGMIDDGVF